MGIFDKMREPVFLKESSDAELQLKRLKEIEPKLNDEGKAKIKQDIKYLEYGIIGENNIAFELKNSHMPMYILHDIYLEDGELSAQIDYLVFTKKICFVIECKNLFGNIEITNTGDFIRTMEFGKTKKKEGIYSPITQNQRHLELMKKIKVGGNKNPIMKLLAEKSFDNYKPIVVLSNPKTVLNAKFAKKEVRSSVIKADQLVSYIKEAYKESKASAFSEKEMLQQAQSYLMLHKDIEHDYTAKYNQYMLDNDTVDLPSVPSSEEASMDKDTLDDINIEETNIYKELKEYRLAKSREERVKPYFIYNNNQLKDIIDLMPNSIEKLMNVNGIGSVKADKYGEDILAIIRKYS